MITEIVLYLMLIVAFIYNIWIFMDDKKRILLISFLISLYDWIRNWLRH